MKLYKIYIQLIFVKTDSQGRTILSVLNQKLRQILKSQDLRISPDQNEWNEILNRKFHFVLEKPRLYSYIHAVRFYLRRLYIFMLLKFKLNSNISNFRNTFLNFRYILKQEIRERSTFWDYAIVYVSKV